jgi:hypothetical protein
MIRIPADPAALAEARAAITTDLEAQGIDAQTIEEAEIVASELLSNAMRHARTLSDGNIRLRWKVRLEVVEVEVTDGGSDTTPRPAPRAVWASSGRGRASFVPGPRVGCERDKSGTTCGLHLGAPAAAAPPESASRLRDLGRCLVVGRIVYAQCVAR